MDWDIEVKLSELEMSVIIYQEHIEILEKENEDLKEEIIFLQEQLEYKTLGKPIFSMEKQIKPKGKPINTNKNQ